jgi:hypothetical protein
MKGAESRLGSNVNPFQKEVQKRLGLWGGLYLRISS